jgi:sterol desaturase/sphingolipid hydroxylase (fatty acid hydroxylase superfamily)
MKSLASLAITIPVLMVLVAGAEGLVLTLLGKTYDWRAYGAALGNMVGRRLTQGIAQALPFGLATASFGLLWKHHLFEVRLRHAGPLAALFVGQELCYYWFHRTSHCVRWFWATHAVHHSPNELNLSVAYQLGWTGELTGSLLFFAPLVWLGFAPQAVLGALALNLLYQFWLHTQWIPKLGALEWLFNTPSHHRVHHACNREYLGARCMGANYGGVLILFDRLFGTFVAERADIPCRYGLTRPLRSYNPLHIAFHEWIAIARDLTGTHDWRERLHVVLGPPAGNPGLLRARSNAPSSR